MMKLIKIIGQPLCVILYIGGIISAFNKKPVPLIALFSLHLTEYFVIGKKTGKENGVSPVKTLIKCLSFGFTWWLPLKTDKQVENQ